MQKSELSPIEKLQMEKKELKRLYEADGARLSENWDYLTNNIGSLTFHTILRGTKDIFSGGSTTPNKVSHVLGNKAEGNPALGYLSSLLPVVWEIAQPMLLSYAVKKIKSMFSSKDKGKKK